MQQRSEKLTEPSMDDILASIRKIISEEPAPAKGTPAAADAPAAADPVSPERPVTEARPFDSARPLEPKAQAATAAASSTPSRLSDMVRELAPMAVPLGTISTATFHDDLADLVESDAPAAVPAASEPTPAATTADGAAAPRSSFGRASDFGSFIPSTAESLGMTGARAIPLSVGADLRASEAAKGTKEQAPLRPLELGVPLPLSSNPTARAEPQPAPAAAIPVPEVPVPATSAPAETEGDSDAAAQTALGALAKGLATPAPAVVAGVPARHAPTAVEDQATMTGRRSLDDTIVDMLRPMISDWLDSNLPEMVEKALLQEMAERGKPSR